METIAETKRCCDCGAEKPLSEFKVVSGGSYQGKHYPNRPGKRCGPCHNLSRAEYAKEYRKKHGRRMEQKRRDRMLVDPEYMARRKQQDRNKYLKSREYHLEYQRRRRAEKRDQIRETDKNKRYKKQYGITLAEFRSRLEANGNKCEICGREFAREPDAKVDHCHKTGAVRGILCGMCNIGLGAYGDEVAKLLSAVKYLERYQNARG